jgi:hypothetical protein
VGAAFLVTRKGARMMRNKRTTKIPHR